MRVGKLTLKNVQRIESLTLNFPPVIREGTPAERAPWTVIVGENGTCKTAILQAIALAAAGSRLAPKLAGPTAASLIGFSAIMMKEGADAASVSTIFTGIGVPEGDTTIRSTVKFDDACGKIRYSYEELPPDEVRAPTKNLLDSAQGRLDFGDVLVAAYGVNRGIAGTNECPYLITPMNRLRPMFGFDSKPVGPGLLTYFRDGRGDIMFRMVNAVLSTGLLPDLLAVELKGDVVLAKQRVGGGTFPVLLSSLSVGYQLTLSWIIDLIGHALDLSDGSLEDTREIVGLAMVDEVVLCIHPNLQISLVRGLMAAFPKVQFVVTTSSPLVLAAMRPDEDLIVRLSIDDLSGLVVRHDVREGRKRDPDARLMTVAEVLERYFGRESVFAGAEGGWLAERQSVAHNPYRSDEEDARLQELTRDLTSAGFRGSPRQVLRGGQEGRAHRRPEGDHREPDRQYPARGAFQPTRTDGQSGGEQRRPGGPRRRARPRTRLSGRARP